MKQLFRVITRLMLGVSLLIWLASCSESPSRFIKKRHSELNNTLDNLNAIAAKVPTQTFDAETADLILRTPVIDLDDIGSYGYEGSANAQLFTLEDLQDPGEQSPAMHLFPSLMTWQMAKSMVKDGNFPHVKKDALQALNRFARWRYAIVIKTRSVRAPQVASPPVSTNLTNKAVYSHGMFTGGELAGDALIYDLNDASFLGGFPFTAQSSDHVESTTYDGDDPNAGLQSRLDRDFTEQIKKSILYGILDRLPQDRVYMSGNLRQRVILERGKKSE
jgi:hypothetical protein